MSELGIETTSFLERHLNRQLLRHAAGSAIFCPRCQVIMDCTRTVVATVHRQLAGQPDECVQSFTQCAVCWDKAQSDVRAAVNRVAAKHPELNARLQVVDGRDVFGRGKRGGK